LFLKIPLYLVAQCPVGNVSQALIDCGLVSSNNGCEPIGEPYVWEGDCEIAMNRILSRSINMDGLTSLNTPTICWGDPNHIDENLPVNCTEPYNVCYGWYCPDKYCENLKMLVKLNMQFIGRTASAWYNEGSFFEGKNYYEAMKRIVCYINAAYDCAGLRRPIVQAGIYEGVEKEVNQIRMNPDWIVIGKTFIPEDQLHYYFNLDGSPKENLFFDRSRMFSHDGHYDITKVETVLWFLHQAFTYIDFGFTALHMGIYWDYAKNDTGYSQLYKVFTTIRNYATENGSFVLINGENPMAPVDNGESAVLGGTNLLLFDFDGRPVRPRELADPQVSGDGINCNQPINIPEFVSSPECEDFQFMSLVDTCTINSFGGSGGGVSPLGCEYNRVPFITYLDFGSGLLNNGLPCPNLEVFDDLIGVPDNSGNSTSTWGFDDTRWFSTILPSECRDA
jgi:hypothetical protein